MTQQWKNNEDGGEEDVQMPLGTSGAEAPAEEYAAPRGPKINTSTIALVAAFAAGLVVLYFLGLGNKPRAASADQVARDQAVQTKIQAMLMNRGETQKLDGFLSDFKLLEDRLHHYFDGNTKIQDLSVNPFEREVAAVAPPSITDAFPTSPAIPADQTEALEMRKAADYFATLKLQMVMLGNPSMAMINSRMLTVGTQLEMFTITDIKTGSVILTFKDKTFDLKSSSPSMSKP